MMMMIIMYLDFYKNMWGFRNFNIRKPAHISNINLQVECAPLRSPDWPCLVGLGLEVAKENEENELKPYS